MRSLVFFNPRQAPMTTRELFSEFDSFFEDFGPARMMSLDSTKALPQGAVQDWKTHSSIEETDKAFLLTVDLPGVLPNDIHLDTEKGRLHIKAERKKEMRSANGVETKTHSQYSQSFSLPDEVNPEAIEAHFENGVLTLALPKEMKSPKKSISIQHGQQASTKNLLERWFSKAEDKAEKKLN